MPIFREVTSTANIIKAKDLQPGMQLTGTFIRTEQGKYGQLHYIDTEKGVVVLAGTASLNWQIEKVKPEDLVRITYLGLKPPTTNSTFNKEMHSWKVEVAIPDKPTPASSFSLSKEEVAF